MAKKSTIHDIARELNVTASTVSRALNDNPRISRATREAVWKTARQLNYQPNQIAAALRSGRTYTVGVLVPTADRSFFSKVVRGIEEEVSQAGYNVIICQSNDRLQNEKANVEALLRLRADGIIASIAKETQTFEHFLELRAKNVPLILFDRVHSKPGVSTVVIDDFMGAYQATKHLIEQGCRRIAHFAGLQHINIYSERLRGYRKALDDHRIPFDEQLVFYFNNLQIEDGIQAMTQLLQLEAPPDAVFSASDYAALGAIQTCKQRGISVPHEMAVAGFANEPFTAFVDPPLTTVDQHSVQMGQIAAQLFLEEVEKQSGSFTPQRVVLSPDLIVRQSSLRST